MRRSSFMTQYKSFAIISNRIHACAFIVWARIFFVVLPLTHPIQPTLIHRTLCPDGEHTHNKYTQYVTRLVPVWEWKSQEVVTWHKWKRNDDIIVTSKQEGRFSWSRLFWFEIIIRKSERDGIILIVMSAEKFMLCLYVFTKTDKSLTPCVWSHAAFSSSSSASALANNLLLSHSDHKQTKSEEISFLLVFFPDLWVCETHTYLESSNFFPYVFWFGVESKCSKQNRSKIYSFVFAALECLVGAKANYNSCFIFRWRRRANFVEYTQTEQWKQAL